MAARIPMMATTTKSSISVNPDSLRNLSLSITHPLSTFCLAHLFCLVILLFSNRLKVTAELFFQVHPLVALYNYCNVGGALSKVQASCSIILCENVTYRKLTRFLYLKTCASD